MELPEGVTATYRKDFKLIRMKISTNIAEDEAEGEEGGDEASEE